MAQLLPILCLLLTTFALVWALRGGRPLELLPSTFWGLSAIIPFLYLRQDFPPDVAGTQAMGIAIAGFALLVGDVASLVFFSGRDRPLAAPGKLDRQLIFALLALAAFTILLPVIHVSLQERIPLLTRLFETGSTPRELSAEREQFSKLLHVPGFIKIMFNWVLVVAAPPLIVSLIALRRYMLAALAMLWSALYALLSLAAFPLVLTGFCCAVGLVSFRGLRWQRAFMLALVAGGVVWMGAGVYRAHVFNDWYRTLDKSSIPAARWERLKASDLPLTPGDIDRIQDPGTPLSVKPTFGTRVDNLLRRSVLIPMEVSDRWYAYFPTQSAGFRKWGELLPWMRGSTWVHPAHAVAQWGYRRLFPERYTESTMAYASIDADAYSLGGLFTVAFVLSGLAVLRISFAALGRSDLLSKALYYCGLGALAIFPFQASLQAMLISQGLALSLIGLAAWNTIRACAPPPKSAN